MENALANFLQAIEYSSEIDYTKSLEAEFNLEELIVPTLHY